MPRPKTKTDLMAAIDQERAALQAVLESLTPEQIVEPGAVGEWSAKDVLAHLVEWEQMVLGWYRAGLRGEMPAMPAPGYKWNQTPQLNQMIYEKHRGRLLGEVLEEFHASHQEIVGVIKELSNEELFTEGRMRGPGRMRWAPTLSRPPAATTCGPAKQSARASRPKGKEGWRCTRLLLNDSP